MVNVRGDWESVFAVFSRPFLFSQQWHLIMVFYLLKFPVIDWWNQMHVYHILRYLQSQRTRPHVDISLGRNLKSVIEYILLHCVCNSFLDIYRENMRKECLPCDCCKQLVFPSYSFIRTILVGSTTYYNIISMQLLNR